MKALLKKIEILTQSIENGFLTLKECNNQMLSLRHEIAEKYEEGSDNFTMCIYPLIDAQTATKEIFDLDYYS